jgi:Spy/CpxP family protein refolding chaperone
MRKAREAGDKEAGRQLKEKRKPVMEARKGYVDQFRAALTDEQKAQLDKSLQEARERMGDKVPRGEKGERKAPKAPPVE